MTEQACAWLASYFETTPKYIAEMLKDEKATTYLLVWPIFEQMLFDGLMTKSKIEAIAKKYAPYYTEIDKELSAKHFHDRYQDSRTYHNLRHKENYSYVSDILLKTYSDLNSEEKLGLLIYVVYRYRNNIFHGNKGIESWSSYTAQIERCMNIMMSLLDCAEMHKGEVE